MTAALPFIEAAAAATTVISTIGSIGAKAAGTAAQVQGAEQAGAAQQQAANYNAGIAQQNVSIINSQTAQQVEQTHRAAVLKIGAMRALYGASGVDVSSGSPLDVLASSTAQAKLDEQTVRYNGEVKALNYKNQAQLDIMGGQQAAAAASSKAASSLLTGTASTLSTVSDLAPSIGSTYKSLFGSSGPSTLDLMPTDI